MTSEQQCSHNWTLPSAKSVVTVTLGSVASSELPRLKCLNCGVVVGQKTHGDIDQHLRQEWLEGYPRLKLTSDGLKYRDPYGTASSFLYRDEQQTVHEVQVSSATDIQLVAFVRIWRKRFTDFGQSGDLDTLIRRHCVTGKAVFAEIGKRGLIHHIAEGAKPKQGKLVPIPPDVYAIALADRKKKDADELKAWAELLIPPSSSVSFQDDTIAALTKIAIQQTNALFDDQIIEPKPVKKKKDANDSRKILDFAEPGVRKIKLD